MSYYYLRSINQSFHAQYQDYYFLFFFSISLPNILLLIAACCCFARINQNIGLFTSIFTNHSHFTPWMYYMDYVYIFLYYNFPLMAYTNKLNTFRALIRMLKVASIFSKFINILVKPLHHSKNSTLPSMLTRIFNQIFYLRERENGGHIIGFTLLPLVFDTK